MKKIEEKTASSLLPKKLFKIILFTVYPAFILHSLVIAPLFTVCDSNVGIPESVTVALYFLFVLIDILVFFISFSVIIYGICQIPPMDLKKVLILIALSPFFKYILKFIISPFIDGWPSVDTLTADIFTYAVSGVMEVLQYAVVMLFTVGAAKKYRSKRDTAIAAQNVSSGTKSMQFAPAIPYKGIFNFKNPLLFGALVSSLVIVVGRVASLAINDLSSNWKIVGINQYIDFFTPYVMEIVIGVAGYFLMLYVYILIHSFVSKGAEE